jgi:hypothetical protein
VICHHPKLSRLPCIEAVEGATFDRTFTLLDEDGEPFIFGQNATCSFGVRTRNDGTVFPLSVTVTPMPGQIRVQAESAQTSGRVGRFIWSGTITDGDRVVVLEANEFYLKEGVTGEISPITPSPPASSNTYQVLDPLQYPNFILSIPVAAPSQTQLYVRGIKQRFGVDYVFQSSSYLQWVGVPVTFPDPVFELYS